MRTYWLVFVLFPMASRTNVEEVRGPDQIQDFWRADGDHQSRNDSDILCHRNVHR